MRKPKNNARNAILVTKALAKKWYNMKQGGMTGVDIAKGCEFNTCTINRHLKTYDPTLENRPPCRIHPALAFFPSVI